MELAWTLWKHRYGHYFVIQCSNPGTLKLVLLIMAIEYFYRLLGSLGISILRSESPKTKEVVLILDVTMHFFG